MTTDYTNTIANELNLKRTQVNAVIELLSADATIPFIARYRKEATGSLDEVAITEIRELADQFNQLADRKKTVIKSLEKHNHLTDELKKKIEETNSLTALEDLYLPYKPKRKTKATIAREKNLEPLAAALFEQTGLVPEKEALKFVNPENNVTTVDEALTGAGHIIAELISENSVARKKLRHLFLTKGNFKSTVAKNKESDGKKYEQYYNWEEPVKSAPSHRILAMRRGEKEDILNLTISPSYDEAITMLSKVFITGKNKDSEFVSTSIEDSYKRLLSKSMETEIRLKTKEFADKEAINVFSDNLRQLLLSPPLGPKCTMGIDPGFRTGCKIACLDQQGKLLEFSTIFPEMGEKKKRDAQSEVLRLCEKHNIEAIAIGNGTAGKETENFIKQIKFNNEIQVILVNESGASIYSASEVAREEFPDLDLTVRGAVSIGRRLMDPLSELVKIEPKSIGVGQYQHDVDQNLLKSSLDDVVISCVNKVGVDVNSASAQLLNYVSGLGPVLSKNIVKYRDENGPFKKRSELKKVKRLGQKAFEQSAGFLRINNGPVVLDRSAVHPETYHIVDQMAGDLDCSVEALMNDDTLRNRIDINKYVTEKTGLPTLKDILNELSKPGRDPRETFQAFSFKKGIDKISDLKKEMLLPGIVTNITAFGAFVDIGVHQDGLVHISQISDKFVKDINTVVKVHQKVNVRVIDVDIERKRISLSMRSDSEQKVKPQKKQKPQKASGFNNPFAEAFNKK